MLNHSFGSTHMNSILIYTAPHQEKWRQLLLLLVY